MNAEVIIITYKLKIPWHRISEWCVQAILCRTLSLITINLRCVLPFRSWLEGMKEDRQQTDVHYRQALHVSSKNCFDTFAGLSGTTAVIFSLAILRHLRPCVPHVTSRIGEGQWWIQGRGLPPPPPYCYQAQAQRAENSFLKTGTPLSQGLHLI